LHFRLLTVVRMLMPRSEKSALQTLEHREINDCSADKPAITNRRVNGCFMWIETIKQAIRTSQQVLGTGRLLRTRLTHIFCAIFCAISTVSA